jgi:UDP-glucose:(heptosyl)LPS alpha-1,3-glucosyltransferase
MTRPINKIAVVVPKYGLVGGAEHFVSELTERIAQRDKYEIHVFANKWLQLSDRIKFHKVPVIAFPKFLTIISFAYFARKKIAKMEFDLIHAHDRIFDADIYTMHGVPHRFWIHEVRKKHMGLNDHVTEWTEEILIKNKRCRRFIPVSRLAEETFQQVYHVDAEKVQVVHPGIDAERFQSLDRELYRREIRNLWGIGQTDIVILFVSMNFAIKGLDTLMAAVARTKLNWSQGKIKLLIVGKGEERKYRLLARSLGIGDDIIFAGVQKEKLERTYMASDMFSILSKFDTFGIAVLEAMAASLPVIVSDNVGAKDLILNGANGFVIDDVADIDSASERIGTLLNKEIRVRMGAAAHETALNNTWESVARKYEFIYNELLEHPS